MPFLLRHVMLLIKDVPRTTKFYEQGLQCQVKYASEHWAELQSGEMQFCLNRVEGYVLFIFETYCE